MNGLQLSSRRRLALGFGMVIFLWTLFGASLAGAQGADSFSQGVAAYKSKNYNKAIEYFSQATRENPDKALVWLYLGLSQNQAKKYEEAILSMEEAAGLDDNLPGLHFNLGIAYYQIKAYDPALVELYQAQQNNPKSGDIALFIGLVLQGKKEYQKAAESFAKARQVDPESAQLALFYEGLSYYKMGRTDAAKEAFNNAIALDQGTGTAESARQYLKSLEQPQKKEKRWWADLSAGYEYDDNLTVDPQDLITQVGDSAAIFELSAGFRFLDRGPYAAEVTYDLYQSIYEDITSFNFQSHTLGLSASRDISNWDLSWNYSYSFNLLGAQDFLESHSTGPVVGVLLTDRLYTSLNLNYTNKNFLQRNLDSRDADNLSLGINQYFFFLNQRAFLYGGYQAIGEDATAPEFDYFGNRITGMVKMPLLFGSEIRLRYQYLFRDYLNPTPSIGVDRQDIRNTATVTLSRKFFKKAEVKFSYQHIDSASNLASVDFKENVVNFSVGFNF